MMEEAQSSPVAALAQEIRAAFRKGTILDLSAAEPLAWARALDFLLVRSDFDPALYAARQFSAAHPNLDYPSNIVTLLSRLPPVAADLLPFEDDPTQEIQVVKRAGAKAVLLLFGDLTHRLGAPIGAIHRWMGRLPVSLVYLRDFRRLFFLDGIPSLGVGRSQAVARLREITSALGCGSVLCYGFSMGGFPALHYALDLGAEAALGIGGLYSVPAGVPRARPLEPYFQHPVSKTSVALRDLYEAAARVPRAALVYGDENERDRDRALYMAGLPSVTFRPVKGYAHHHLVIELIRRGEFGDVLKSGLGLE
jgi:hypothetical protein